jgi:hypothetical protein
MEVRMRAWLLSIVLAVAVLAPGAASAQRRMFNAGGVSQLGGQTVPASRNALMAGGLYPSFMWGQYTLGMSQGFDLGLRGDFYFASPLSTGDFGLGFGFGVPMRVGLSQSNKVAFALKLAPDFILGEFGDGDWHWNCYYDNRGRRFCRGDPDWNRDYDDDFGVGFGFEFGLLVGIPVSIVNIVTGITSPIHFVYIDAADDFVFVFPFAPFGGAEVRLTQDLNVFGMFQFGMAIQKWEDDTDLDGFFRFWAGIQYAL